MCGQVNPGSTALPHGTLCKSVPGFFPAGKGGFSSAGEDLERLGLLYRNPLRLPDYSHRVCMLRGTIRGCQHEGSSGTEEQS